LGQLSIFEFLSGQIETFYSHGAMYALAPEEFIFLVPVELGDSVIYPGQFVSQLGEKERSCFSMTEGNLLRFVGRADNLLLFSVNDLVSNYYYAFAYIDRNTLLIGSRKGCKDICIQKLNVVA
jgi:hypothetical protein